MSVGEGQGPGSLGSRTALRSAPCSGPMPLTYDFPTYDFFFHHFLLLLTSQLPFKSTLGTAQHLHLQRLRCPLFGDVAAQAWQLSYCPT